MKLLLHTCCGPCLSGVHPVLVPEQFDMTAFFYNPNIHPEEEHAKRIGSFINYSDANRIKTVINDEYGRDLFEKEVIGRKGDRCENCYRLRLGETAKYAKNNQFDSFSTTILISPYQKHDLLKKVGEDLSKEYGIIFYYKDFRPFYKNSIMLSRQLGLYRQKYCGCYKSFGGERK